MPKRQTPQLYHVLYSTEKFEVHLRKPGFNFGQNRVIERYIRPTEARMPKNETELKSCKDACKKEIQAFRKELDDFLDKLVQNMIAELDQYESKERRRIDQHITTLKTIIQMLDKEHKSLEKARKDVRKENMFVAETRVSANLRDYQTRLVDLEKFETNFRLTFKRNTRLDDLQRCVEALGTLRLQDNKVQKIKKTVLLGCQIQSHRKVNVRLADDKYGPEISGCVLLSNGYVVACDDVNNKIKLLDSSLLLQGSLKLPSNPRDIAVIDNNTVIVTMPPQKQLQYIQVFPQTWQCHSAGQMVLGCRCQ